MPHIFSRVAIVSLVAFVTIGCDRSKPAPVADSTIDSVAPRNPASDSLAVIPTGWESDAGPYVVLPTVDGGQTSGSLLRPGVEGERLGDTTGLTSIVAPGRLELFSRSGRIGTAQLSVEQSRRIEPECAAWPTARLTPDSAIGSRSWTAAFAEGRVVAIPLDSIEGMKQRDSARLAADLTRLASALPDDSSSVFRGLPFVVLRAYQARDNQTDFVIATLIRRINQEDSPREERLVMVADMPSELTSRRWRVAWYERASGTEDELLVAEPLLAYRAKGAADVRVLFGRDDGFSLSAAVLTRTVSGWSLQWESPASGCDVGWQ